MKKIELADKVEGLKDAICDYIDGVEAEIVAKREIERARRKCIGLVSDETLIDLSAYLHASHVQCPRCHRESEIAIVRDSGCCIDCWRVVDNTQTDKEEVG